MMRLYEEVAEAESEASAELPVDFQAGLFGIGYPAVALHSSGADATGAV
jgi:hypothetical protein